MTFTAVSVCVSVRSDADRPVAHWGVNVSDPVKVADHLNRSIVIFTSAGSETNQKGSAALESVSLIVYVKVSSPT